MANVKIYKYLLHTFVPVLFQRYKNFKFFTFKKYVKVMEWNFLNYTTRWQMPKFTNVRSSQAVLEWYCDIFILTSAGMPPSVIVYCEQTADLEAPIFHMYARQFSLKSSTSLTFIFQRQRFESPYWWTERKRFEINHYFFTIMWAIKVPSNDIFGDVAHEFDLPGTFSRS